MIWDARLLSEGMSKKGKQDVTILLSQLPQEKRKDFVELICKSSQGMDEDDKLSLIIIEGTENKHELIPLLRSMDLYYKFETIELMQEDFVQDAITRINLRIIPINDY